MSTMEAMNARFASATSWADDSAPVNLCPGGKSSVTKTSQSFLIARLLAHKPFNKDSFKACFNKGRYM
ncbi:hypothetical protein M0R45_021361 [Rubus argutus]|uniref:Uncharacterized protein n=1 Tax=Rubus argutus TaxID=59490 RepID=A0AAW1XCX3_RUBAR